MPPESERLEHLVKRLTAWKNATLNRIRKKSWVVGSIVTVAVLTVGLLLQNGYLKVVGAALSWVLGLLATASTRSVGWGGLVLFAFIGINLLVLVWSAFLETRPAPPEYVAFERERNEAVAARSKAESDLAEERRNSLALWWLLRFGMDRPGVGVRSADAEREIERLRPVLADLQSPWRTLTSALADTLRARGEFDQNAFDLYSYTFLSRVGTAFRYLALQGDEDPQALLVVFYGNYHEVRSNLTGMADAARISLTEIPVYREWYEADERLHARLTEALATSALVNVRAAIEELRAKFGYPKPMPAPPVRYRGGARSPKLGFVQVDGQGVQQHTPDELPPAPQKP